MPKEIQKKEQALLHFSRALADWEKRVQGMIEEARRIQSLVSRKLKRELHFGVNRTFLTSADKLWLQYENEILTLQLKLEMLEGGRQSENDVTDAENHSVHVELPTSTDLDSFLNKLSEAEPGTVCELIGTSGVIPVVVISEGINTFAVNDLNYLSKLMEGKRPVIQKTYRCLDSSHRHKPELDEDGLFLHFKEEHRSVDQQRVAS